MHIRSKAYLHFLSHWRSRRVGRSPQSGGVSGGPSPLLLFIAVVLALFLAIVEVDLHRGELAALGLPTNLDPALGPLFGP
ncbi:MAG: hypothetical protein AB1586_19740 [Pseudomonadota bacterium]